MEIEVTVKKKVNATTLKVRAKVRYWEGANVNGIPDTEDGDNIPCKNGDYWCPIIDIDTETITNWEQGKTAEIYYKVCDQCSWEVYTDKIECIVSVEGEYVPTILRPEEDYDSDYIIMNVNEFGVIDNWNNSYLFDLFEYE